MTNRRLFIHSVFVLLLPLIVAWYDFSTAAALALVLLALAWRWAIALSGIVAPEDVPDLELETVTISHFVEKVRWCMDRLGLEYTERQMAGTLGVFFTGRTVPQLKVRTGIVRTTIGDSPDILRYLWGANYAGSGGRAGFLEPTAERLAWEKKFDRYGVDLQVWVYYHILDDRALTQYVWGCSDPSIPAWQRYTVTVFFPVFRALMKRTFRITDAHYAKAVEHIETLLGELEKILTPGRTSILGGESIDYVDITFASLSALWLQPPEFGGGKTGAIRLEQGRMPPALRSDVERWSANYPGVCGFVRQLYKQERESVPK